MSLSHTLTHAEPQASFTASWPPQDDDKNFRRAPSWRKKFRPKDMRGMSLGVSDTLPANFRVTGSNTASPSMQPKRSAMDGKITTRTSPSVALLDLQTAHTLSVLLDRLCCFFGLFLFLFFFSCAVTNGMSLHVTFVLPWKHRKSVYTKTGHCHSQDLLLLTHNGKMEVSLESVLQ